MVDESGKTLGIIASIIGCVLLFIAFLLLKTDPIRDEASGRKEALQQVKAFASFIQTKPELAHPQERSVMTMARSRMNEVRGVQNLKTPLAEFSWEQSVQPYLSQVSTPEGKEAIRREIRADPGAVFQYIEKDFNSAQPAHDFSWENKMEVLLMLNEDSLLGNGVKERSLDLIAEQLVQSRSANSDIIKAHTDSWFERYIRLEKRPEVRERKMNEFNEKIIQSIR